MSFVSIHSDFGIHLRQLRLEKKLTQEQLAQELHVTRQNINGWERGKHEPDIGTILKLAEILDITVDELLASGGEKEVTVNYRRGGLIMLPFVCIGLVAALVSGAPLPALLSIGFWGFIPAFILIGIGKCTTKK